MIKLLSMITLWCILTISNSHFVAQDRCELATINSVDVKISSILFIVSNDMEQQIWQYSFAENTALDTGLRIPSNASQLILSPGSNQLAYFFRDSISTNSDKVGLKINVLDVTTANGIIAFSKNLPDISQVINLRWLNGNHLGFISNGRAQQYTLVNIESGELATYQSEIPIPPHNGIGESIRGDWHIEYSPNFSHAAFMNFRDYASSITFWDLASGQLIDTTYMELPVSWIEINRAFKWINEGKFLIMSEESNWFEISLETKTIRQITDIGDRYRLHAPTIAPNLISIAFQKYDLANLMSSIAIWNGKTLIESCLNEVGGQYLMSSDGWDDNSRYFAFTVYDYDNDKTSIYVFDTETEALSSIHSLNHADPKAMVIGWIEIN